MCFDAEYQYLVAWKHAQAEPVEQASKIFTLNQKCNNKSTFLAVKRKKGILSYKENSCFKEGKRN